MVLGLILTYSDVYQRPLAFLQILMETLEQRKRPMMLMPAEGCTLKIKSENTFTLLQMNTNLQGK